MAIEGFNINRMFEQIHSTIETKGAELQRQLDEVGKDGELSDQDMLKMQFMVNQYNTLLETASTVTKALVDEAKQIAQRAN